MGDLATELPCSCDGGTPAELGDTAVPNMPEKHEGHVQEISSSNAENLDMLHNQRDRLNFVN